MGSINVLYTETIKSEIKNESRFPLFARQNGQPVLWANACAGEELLSNSAPSLSFELNGIIFSASHLYSETIHCPTQQNLRKIK